LTTDVLALIAETNLRRSGFPGLLFCPDSAAGARNQDISARDERNVWKETIRQPTVRLVFRFESFEGVSRL
jgi:hypothetical protein